MEVERLSQVERINVIGTSGSGKSTFGRKLAQLLRLPFFELDQLHWGPNWQETPPEQMLLKVQRVTDSPRWVLDGNYLKTTPVKWQQVQLVVWLDMSFPRTIYRVASRCLTRAWTRTELWPGTGNRESLRKSFFSRDSVILWSIRSFRKHRQHYPKVMASPEYSHIWFVRLRSPRECDEFLAAAARITVKDLATGERHAEFE